MIFTEESLKFNPLNVNKNNVPSKTNNNVTARPQKIHKPMILKEDENRSNSFNPEIEIQCMRVDAFDFVWS